MHRLLFKLENGAALAPIAFADDTLVCLLLNDETEVDLLSQAFAIVGRATGLRINPSKTVVLAIGRVPANIQLIGKVEKMYSVAKYMKRHFFLL